MLSALILTEDSDVFAMPDFPETVIPVRISTNARRTRHSVPTENASISQDRSDASVRWASWHQAPETSKIVLILMNVNFSPMFAFTGLVRIRTGCSSVTVTMVTSQASFSKSFLMLLSLQSSEQLYFYKYKTFVIKPRGQTSLVGTALISTSARTSTVVCTESVRTRRGDTTVTALTALILCQVIQKFFYIFPT